MYQALITHITVREHPNPEIKRLAVGNAAGHQLIVSKDTPEGTLGVLFPPDGQLSHEMCYHNNLYRLGKGENADPKASGYFEENRRVRTQKFKGIASEGIWFPLESLAWTGADLSELKAGETITALNGKLLCEKYYSKATRRAMDQQKKQGRKTKLAPMFKEHFDTPQLRYTIGAIPDGARLIITEKLHGTSGRSMHGQVVEIKQILPFYLETYLLALAWLSSYISLPNWLFPDLSRYEVEETRWEHIMGTRRVVRFGEGNSVGDWYAGTNFRDQIHKNLALHKGETLYYEIVGYDENGGTIMATYGLDGDDEVYKELRKQYGKAPMVFSYGQEPGTYGVWVYRITMTNEDGYSVEYSHDQVVARCRELGLKVVPTLAIHQLVGDFTKESLIELCSKLARGPSTLDSKHIREGVCVRVESPEMNTILKWKGFEFAHLEGIAKNEDTFVDLEDVS